MSPLELIAAFREEMAQLAVAYAKERTVHQQREAAGYMVARMQQLLDELGAFDHSIPGSRGPLLDLIGMLRDLNLGRNHPWGEPEKLGGSGIERTAERERRIWAMSAVKVLQSAEFGLNDSCRQVAEALSRKGMAGRQAKGETFPWKTVKRWVAEADEEAAARADRTKDAFWAAIACEHAPDPRDCRANGGAPCYPIASVAQQFLARDDPLLDLITRRLNSATFG